MANSFYSPSGIPATGAQGSSSDVRSEFDAIEDGFDLMPALTASRIVVVNSGGTALESIANLAVAQGGTGTTTLTDGGILLGSGTGAITALAVLADGEMLVGDGTTDPAIESGATLRTSIGVGTGDSPTFTALTLTSTLTVGGVLSQDDTTDSTSTITGSIHTDGGLGVAKNFHVNGDLVTTDATSVTNTKIGVGAGDAITSGGTNNTAFGNDALGAITTGDDCTAIGKNALLLSTGSDNTAVGSLSLDANTSGINNTAVGKSALSTITTNSNNTAVGANALIVNSAANNTAVGSSALFSNTTGSNNTGIGLNALAFIVSTNDCTAVGADCLKLNTAADNTAVGSLSLDANTSGTRNTAVGKSSLSAVVTGADCTAIGFDALVINTGIQNTAVGSKALDSCTSGKENVAVGYLAMDLLNTANACVAIGMFSNASVTSGGNNTSIGRSANTTGTTGASNTCLGAFTNVSTSGAVGQVAIGSNVAADQDHQVVIGSASGNIKNEFDTDNAWTQSSDRRKKTNIKDAKLGLDFILDLRPVTYNLRPASEWPKEWGVPSDTIIDTEKTMHSFLAQDVLKALNNADVDPGTFAGWGEDKQGQRISKEMFVFPLVNAIKELTTRLEKLEEAS